jgi:hypothetical protein
MDTEEPCARPRLSLTPPHACELFTLKQIFGSLWLATCPCARRTTDRSVPARCSLELNNKGDYPVIQSLCGGLCCASRLRFGHSAELPLNFLRSHAQSSKHSNPSAGGSFGTNSPVDPLREQFQPPWSSFRWRPSSGVVHQPPCLESPLAPD